MGRLARAIGGHAVLFAGLALLGAMLLASTFACVLIVLPMSREGRRRTTRAMASGTFRGYLAVLRAVGVLRVDLSPLDALRGGPLVVAPNHPSLLDAVFVISRLPDSTCIMKAELWDNFFLGAGARMAGYIRNDTPRTMVRLAVDSLKQGGQLLVFPEGTRTVRAPVNPLKGAFALIAKKSRTPVQIVFIETDSPFLRKGWPLWKRPEFPLVYRVRLGPRIDASGPTEDTLAQVDAVFARELGGRTVPPPARAALREDAAFDA
jgi:1-acyl-sn-glycerol-3-phosphate acyltransferase